MHEHQNNTDYKILMRKHTNNTDYINTLQDNLISLHNSDGQNSLFIGCTQFAGYKQSFNYFDHRPIFYFVDKTF